MLTEVNVLKITMFATVLQYFLILGSTKSRINVSGLGSFSSGHLRGSDLEKV